MPILFWLHAAWQWPEVGFPAPVPRGALENPLGGVLPWRWGYRCTCRKRVSKHARLDGPARGRYVYIRMLVLNTPARKASVGAAAPAGDCAALCTGAVMAPGAAVLAR